MTLQMTLKMTLNHQNNTINRFFQLKSLENGYYTCAQMFFVKNDIFSYLTLKLTFDLEDDLE